MTPYILLVEDDPSVREACCQTLELADYAVHACDSAEAALQHFARHPDCIVLTDVRLPGMDGLQLMAALRQADPELPVTLVTGHGDVGMAVQAMRDGAWDFLEKPWQRERLLEVLARAGPAPPAAGKPPLAGRARHHRQFAAGRLAGYPPVQGPVGNGGGNRRRCAGTGRNR
jgi:FixJ family two-component response regulator